jgi:hypothetical protein
MDWIASLLFFLFRGEIPGPASIANARFIDDTLSLSQRVVNRNRSHGRKIGKWSWERSSPWVLKKREIQKFNERLQQLTRR